MTAFVDRRDPAMAKWLASTKVESGNINNGGIAFNRYSLLVRCKYWRYIELHVNQ